MDAREHAGIDPERLRALFERTARGVEPHPGCSAQVAVARHGRLAGFASFGRAPIAGAERAAEPGTLFVLFSVTKAITASAVWILLQEGKLALDDRVADAVPEFGENGKGAVTVEQLLTHTCGFPKAEMPPSVWADRERRLEQFARWRLEWEPGSRFVYHGLSSMWVLAELIERVSGQDHRAFIRGRVARPLGLDDLHVGLPHDQNHRVADVVPVGEAPAEGGRQQLLVDAPAISDAEYTRFNEPRMRALGIPGGGGIATAAAVAMFYQGVLEDAAGRGPGVWQRDQLAEVFRPRTGDLLDPMTKQPALRGLGVVVAGPEGRVFRGFADACSPRAIGHMGAGGQIAWADPETGLSFAYVTNGAWRDPVRQGAQGLTLSTLAARALVD
ncbi:MAG: serine hydrolase domain-containing protein [Myxococcota bacterium]|nr:serine hydrolase domain-containing protein [Myxococcota bacterium]